MSVLVRLSVFRNKVLRKIFGPKGEEVTGGWRKVHEEELHTLYSSPYGIHEDEMGRLCDTHCREEKWLQGFGGETQRKHRADPDIDGQIILWIVKK